jgi:hypothetical protein
VIIGESGRINTVSILVTFAFSWNLQYIELFLPFKLANSHFKLLIYPNWYNPVFRNLSVKERETIKIDIVNITSFVVVAPNLFQLYTVVVFVILPSNYFSKAHLRYSVKKLS